MRKLTQTANVWSTQEARSDGQHPSALHDAPFHNRCATHTTQIERLYAHAPLPGCSLSRELDSLVNARASTMGARRPQSPPAAHTQQEAARRPPRPPAAARPSQRGIGQRIVVTSRKCTPPQRPKHRPQRTPPGHGMLSRLRARKPVEASPVKPALPGPAVSHNHRGARTMGVVQQAAGSHTWAATPLTSRTNPRNCARQRAAHPRRLFSNPAPAKQDRRPHAALHTGCVGRQPRAAGPTQPQAAPASLSSSAVTSSAMVGTPLSLGLLLGLALGAAPLLGELPLRRHAARERDVLGPLPSPLRYVLIWPVLQVDPGSPQ